MRDVHDPRCEMPCALPFFFAKAPPNALLTATTHPSAVATHEQLVSKAFHGRHGRAFLFAAAANVQLGPKEERILMTGLHTVADVYCSECTSRLGWKYLEAFETRCARRALQGSATFLFPPCPTPAPLIASAFRSSVSVRSQKYKEGKFILEKSRFVEGEPL